MTFGDLLSIFLKDASPLLVIGTLYVVSILLGLFSKKFREYFVEYLSKINRSAGQIIGLTIGFDSPPSKSRSEDDARFQRLEERVASLKEGDGNAIEVNISSDLERKIADIFKYQLEEKVSPLFQNSLSLLIDRGARDIAESRSIDTLVGAMDHLKSASTTVAIRGFFNLAFGIIFAGGALYLLKQSIEMFTVDQIKTLTMAQVSYFVGIRISLAMITTLIAYFFLSLYRKILEDVKFYQNEITLLSGKISALSLSLSAGNSDSIQKFVSILMDVDRNKAILSQEKVAPDDIIGKLIDKIPNFSVGK